MTKETAILKIVKEDIIRILSEKKVSLDSIRAEIKVLYSFISEAIEELKKEELIHPQRGFFELTEKGREKAKDILRKHLVCENYFKKNGNEEEAHEIAHILEHYVSQEVLNNIKELSTFADKGDSLTKLKPQKEGLITDIMISDEKLFERIVSMGIFPGEKIVLILWALIIAIAYGLIWPSTRVDGPWFCKILLYAPEYEALQKPHPWHPP